MALTIEELLQGKPENHILPFFWQHGEDEETLREYMRVIAESNCGAVCVESRPHPDFVGEKWWRDMDIILDEAKKRDMKVWILDDSHFPTGFANGAVKDAPLELKRQSIYCYMQPVRGKREKFTYSLKKIAKKIPISFVGKVVAKGMNKDGETFDDDRLLGVTVMTKDSKEPVEAGWYMDGDKLTVNLPEGAQKVQILFLTRNAGIHRSYINMMDEESCRILIDTVYETHWEHYKEEFGKTIAGFFSDEPEIGNGYYFCNETRMGGDFDFPWSRRVEEAMPELLGEDWKRKLPLIWENGGDADETARVRYLYMNLVTRLVEKNFSRQIGTWCEEHGVEYIGHVIEDGNAHARTANSLGHFFRGLAGQHMAGIDDIGGQVLPYKEDAPAEGIYKIMGGRDGEFYHYMLAALGASYAAIDPIKKGRCMCEIFGNYGWQEGPRMEKYLADHFMVSGINCYVPHAFSGKKYPDPDCPPHFYAYGHNPQYRHFGQVISYMNRVCSLISDGKPVVDVAVLYHGESEWCGEAMLDQKITRILSEKQICFHVVPSDVFEECERYAVKIGDGLEINGNHYHTLIVPCAEYIRREVAESIVKLQDAGCQVLFVDARPKGICEGGALPETVGAAPVCTLQELAARLPREAVIEPASWRMRYYHYIGAEELYYFVNEDDKTYDGVAELEGEVDCYAYDAWENQAYEQKSEKRNGKTRVLLHLKPSESRILIVGRREDYAKEAIPEGRKLALVKGWKMAACKSIEYPSFGEFKAIEKFEDYAKTNKKFSGFLAYETTLDMNVVNLSRQEGRVILEITDAGEDVEVFVNGNSAGIQVLPPFFYDITGLLNDTENVLRIEVATTLERERGANKKNQAPIGILGEVNLYIE